MNVDLSKTLVRNQHCSCCILFHFVVFKRQPESWLSTRDDFQEYSQVTICSSGKIRVSGCHTHENASRVSKLLLELTSSLCCHRMATGIGLIKTRFFARLFARDMFYWSLTHSEVKITAQGCHSHKKASLESEPLLEPTSSLCCLQKATRIVLINTRCLSRLFAHDDLLFN